MSSLRELRQAANLTQVELAELAGVSRQLIGAVEAGRHLPRVDAAVALAAALDADVATLFSPKTAPRDVVFGEAPRDGSSVRIGYVGQATVTAPARVGPEGWDVADGMVQDGVIAPFGTHRPGLVVAGCEPGLELVERILREKGVGSVAVPTSSQAAIGALEGGRVHACVVHGPGPTKRSPGKEVVRFGLTSWQVGIAAPDDAAPDWWEQALAGRVPVVQREDGAGVQRAFENAATSRQPIPGPRVGSHLQAASRAVLTGNPAVTIEPAALAMGAAFHAIELHEAELWVAAAWVNDRVVEDALNVITSRRFQARLTAVGGYGLTNCGKRLT